MRSQPLAASLGRGLSLLVLATAGLGSGGEAAADTVTLKNGDRITGEVVRKEDGTLILKTGYAGEIKIQWAQVAALVTDKPVRIQLEDGTAFEARLGAGAQGTAALEPAPAPQPTDVTLTRIAYLNPTPEQSGIGVTYKRRLGLAVNLVRGNTDSGRFHGEGEFVARAKEYRYRLFAEGTRASEGGTTTESNWRATGSYDWFLRPREFLYGRMSFEHDGFRDLKLRSQIGGGYGYQFIETKDTELSAQLGPDFVRALYYNDPDESFVAAGWGIHYAQWFWSRAFQGYFDQSGFWNLENTDDVVVHSVLGLRVPLKGGLNATTEVKVDYDSDPVPGTASTDTTFLLGLGYTW